MTYEPSVGGEASFAAPLLIAQYRQLFYRPETVNLYSRKVNHCNHIV